MSLLALVDLDDLLRVDGKTDVRIHDDAEQAGVSLEEFKHVIIKLASK